MTTLNENQRNLLVGTLLGDGNLQTFSKGKTWRYRALQQASQKEYLFHKYEVLKNLCGSEPVFGSPEDLRTGKKAERWYFNTKVDSSLKEFGDLFYKLNQTGERFTKDVPTNIKELLTPQAVAYLYMDDGALKWVGHSNAMRICTDSFSEAGVLNLINALNSNYGLKTNMTVERKDGIIVARRIAIPEKDAVRFVELIKPFLIDCMKYKVSDLNRGRLGPKP